MENGMITEDYKKYRNSINPFLFLLPLYFNIKKQRLFNLHEMASVHIAALNG